MKEYCTLLKQDKIWHITSCGVKIMVYVKAMKKAMKVMGIKRCFNCEKPIKWGKKK